MAEQTLAPACDADVTLDRADFADWCPGVTDDSVDLVLTDPPYAISRQTTFVRGGMDRYHVVTEFGEWDEQEIDLAALASHAYRILRKGGTAIIWYDLWKVTTIRDAMLDAGFGMLRTIWWHKTNTVPMNSHASYLTNSREMAVVAVKGGKPTFHSSYDAGNYFAAIPSVERTHPTQKPLPVFRELVLKHSNPNDLVVDCFAGSGTTAVACCETGRRFAGCELDDGYHQAASERIDAARRQGLLPLAVDERPSRTVRRSSQVEMFA